MNQNQSNVTVTIVNKSVSGYKVIQNNVADRTENLYAVVTPIKMKE